MKAVPVDLHIATDGHVRGSNEFVVIVNVLVLATLEELALHDPGVLLRGLVDRDRVVSEEERDDEAAVNVLGNLGVEPSDEAQNGLVVVHVLEEVTLRLVGHQLVYVTERVDLVTETVVGWDLSDCAFSRLGVLDLTEGEVTAEFGFEELLSEVVYTSYQEVSSV